jgi:hypothetical protein
MDIPIDPRPIRTPLRYLVEEGNEQHRGRAVPMEWVEEMFRARLEWGRQIQMCQPEQVPAYIRYNEFRSKLPEGLVIELMQA